MYTTQVLGNTREAHGDRRTWRECNVRFTCYYVIIITPCFIHSLHECCNSSSDEMFEVDSPWPRRNPHKDNSTITERSIYPNATRQSLLKSLRGETHRESRAEAVCQGFNERVSAARSGGRTEHSRTRNHGRAFLLWLLIYI